MNMKLLRYRVMDFKSIKDSGWIDCDDVTTLVGVNESGKSNLLLALWKLNPAQGGGIRFTDDMPVKSLSDFRVMEKKPRFIEAEFQIVSIPVLKELSEASGCEKSQLEIVHVFKDYDNNTYVEFPMYTPFPGYTANEIIDVLKKSETEIEAAEELRGEKGLKSKAVSLLSQTIEQVSTVEFVSEEILSNIIDDLVSIDLPDLKTSVIKAVLERTIEVLSEQKDAFINNLPSESDKVKSIVLRSMPKFVYYSNYGNLDSEIYLPHVIDNMQRNDLSSAAEAKVRTLKTLFEYVKLSPKEIMEMGEVDQSSSEKIEQGAEKTKEREILLQSASAKLTREFKEWWKQGEYSFDLRADGRFFRIWVSDAQRPERIVLENRSTGLQWFLSFYIVFLVESKESHANSILLLDEAGMSLHPLAQKDLTAFFENLAQTNQIIHTTHSPFLVDTNNIDRTKVVYVDSDGYTVASSNLRATEAPQCSKSVYAIHAALGLSVSDVLLQGCRPIIVEGPSDQYYFNAIKQYLIGKGLIKPMEEIVFMPSGGVKGISQLAALVASKSGLPYVIVDSDKSGRSYHDKLTKELYTGSEASKILSMSEFVKIDNAETEDIIPFSIIGKYVDRMLHNDDDDDFSDSYDADVALVPQIESFAQEHSIELESGYKVEIAKAFKQTILKKKSVMKDVTTEQIWVGLFEKMLEERI